MDQDDLGNLIGMNQRKQTNQTLRRLEQQRRGVGACPHCGGGLPNLGVSVCMHCQKDLVWYKTAVGKPGQEALCKSQYIKTQASAAAGQAAVLSHRKKLLKFFYAPAFFLYIPYLLCCWLTSDDWGWVDPDGVGFVWQLMTLCGLLGRNYPLLMVFAFIHMVWVILAIGTPFMWFSTLEDT